MPMSTTPPAFSRSLEAFKCQLSLQDIEAFEFATFKELKHAIDHIQKEQAQRRGYRNLNKIRPFLVFLEQYARVIEQFVSAKPDFLAFIWGPIKLCLQVASRLSEAFDSLLDAYAKIGESLPVFAAVDTLFAAHGDLYVQQILANIYEDILKFHSRAIRFFEQRTWKIAFKTAFRSFSDLYGDVVKTLQGSKELLVQTASVWHFQEAQNARVHISQEFESHKIRDDQHRKSYVVDWLSHVSCQSRHKELRREQRSYPGSTRWMFSTTELSEWFRAGETNSPILWISGIPGAGKTFMFSSLIEDINGRLPKSEVIYFYCRFDDPLRRTFNGIVRSLIAQLLARNPTCSQYLYDEINRSVNRRPHSTNDLCAEMLEKIALHHDQLFIGIDGLDECQELERQQLLSMIHNLLKASKITGKIRVFLTSRREKDIVISLRSASRLELRPYHLEKDIRNYVKVRVQHLGDKFSIALERQRTIVTDIASRSQGMFLLARLIMDNLIDQDCRQDLEEELREEILPNGIDQAYARVLGRLQKKNPSAKTWRRAKFGLDILATATRPLTIHEMNGAFSIRLEDKSIDFENRRSLTPIDELLGPIVEVHLDSSINFIHPTAKDYLLQHHSGYFIDSSAANLRMALLCSSYLTLPCFSPYLDLSDIETSVHKGDYAFQEYAALNWIQHAKSSTNYDEVATNVDSRSLVDTVATIYQRHLEQFATDDLGSNTEDFESNVRYILAVLDKYQKAYDMKDNICLNDYDSEFTPHLLRRVGEVRDILEQLSPQAFKDSPLFVEAYGKSLYKCPVMRCSRFQRGFTSRTLRDEHLLSHERAHKCTVEGCDYLVIGFPTSADLISHGQLCHCELSEEVSFPSVKRASLSQTLKNAIDRDDAPAVRALCVEMVRYPIDEIGFLFRAVKRKSFDAASVVLELLGSKELHYEAKDGRTVLHEAVEAMNVDLLKNILCKDVDINAKDSKGRTPLSIALESGHFEAVRLLLSPSDGKWLYVDALKKGLIKAASGGQDDIVREILSTLAFYRAEDKRYLSMAISKASVAAALNDHEKTVKTILDMGRQMNLDKDYPERFSKASQNGMEAIKLLEKSEVDEEGKTKGGALARAARKGDSATVLRLLEMGADINYGSGMVHNALQAAANYGISSMVNLLLDNGADVDSQVGMDKKSALQLASSRNSDQIVQILLDRGADVNAQGGRWGNPLQAASSNGDKKVVQMLLDNGADVNAQDRSRSSALQAASARGHFQVVQMLLYNGADVNTQGGEYGNALQAASVKGHKQVVELLRERGAKKVAP